LTLGAAARLQRQLEDAPSSSSDGGESSYGSGASPWEGSDMVSVLPPPGAPQKVIVVLRHGASTWNEQVRVHCFPPATTGMHASIQP
jgi:hypothetical protein